MNILSKTAPAEAEKVLAEYSRAPPRPRRYRARSRYRFEDAYVPLQGKPPLDACFACGQSGPIATSSKTTFTGTTSAVEALIVAGGPSDIPNESVLRKEVFLRGKLAEHMNEMAYAHRMYTEVELEHKKVLTVIADRKLQVTKSS
jgi:hypothetical protein